MSFLRVDARFMSAEEPLTRARDELAAYLPSISRPDTIDGTLQAALVALYIMPKMQAKTFLRTDC